MHEQVGEARRPRSHSPEAEGPRPPRRRRPTSMTVFATIVACVVVLGGVTGIRAILTRSAPRKATSVPVTSCTPPRAGATVPVGRLGAWRFDVLETGTYGSIVASPSGVYAIQACGAEETTLRIVEFAPGAVGLRASRGFGHAALLTSSLVLEDGSLYLGAATLDLSGPTSAPPYELTLYRLSPATLQVLGSRQLGRGYTLAMFQAPGSAPAATALIASTGAGLYSIDPITLASRLFASFGSSVAQHVAAGGLSPYVAVSVFKPSSSPPAETAEIELLAYPSGHGVGTVRLPSGADPESLVLAGGSLWASVGEGLSTQVVRYSIPGLVQGPGGGTNLPTSLQAVSLDGPRLAGSPEVVYAHGLTLLACLDATNGRVLATTTLEGTPPPSVSEVESMGRATLAVTGGAIGTLSVPPACAGSPDAG